MLEDWCGRNAVGIGFQRIKDKAGCSEDFLYENKIVTITNSIPSWSGRCGSFIQLFTSQLRHRKGPVAKYINPIQCI